MKHLIWTCCLTILISGGWGFGQGTAQISGTVRDQSGAVLPGVQVTATQTETGISRNTVTNKTGSYALPNLVLGPYRLEVALAGFRTYVQTGIVLQVESNAVINARWVYRQIRNGKALGEILSPHRPRMGSKGQRTHFDAHILWIVE